MRCLSCKKEYPGKTRSTVLCDNCFKTALEEYKHGYVLTTDLCRVGSAHELKLLNDDTLINFIRADFKVLNEEIAAINQYFAKNCPLYGKYDFPKLVHEYEDSHCTIQIFKQKYGFSVSVSSKYKRGQFLSHEVKENTHNWFTLTNLRTDIDNCKAMYGFLKTVGWWKSCQ